ncbi:unnamed protein product [Closterium sp. NIES-53]
MGGGGWVEVAVVSSAAPVVRRCASGSPTSLLRQSPVGPLLLPLVLAAEPVTPVVRRCTSAPPPHLPFVISSSFASCFALLVVLITPHFGYGDYFDDGTGWVCKLLKSLYGLKQSPLLWYRALDGVLLGASWKKSQVDEALYFKAGDIGVTCWVLVYVDDLLAAISSPAMLKELKELLEAAFELREILPVVKYLGLEIVRDRPAKKLWLHQQGYTDKLRSIGERLTAASYLADTRDTALEFGGGLESLELIGYVDADDAGDKQKGTSTSGYVFVYGEAVVFWSSSGIKCATLSLTESEYIAATNAGKEGRRIRFLLAEFKLLDAGKPAILRVDNKSAITVAEGLGLTGKLKHMERCYAWLQHMVRRGKFVLKYIPTTE